MRTLSRRAAAFLRVGLERFLLAVFLPAAFFDGAFLAGRAGRDAVVFFFELRARVLLVFFFFDVFLEAAFEADFFRVTFFPASFRFVADLPALVVFFFAFFLAFFLAEVFLLEAVFFLTAFFLLAFFEVRATGRLRELRLAVFFETFFLAAAFFFGMRSVPGGSK